MASAGALMTVVALTLSSATWLPPHELSLSPVLTLAKSGTNRGVARSCPDSVESLSRNLRLAGPQRVEAHTGCIVVCCVTLDHMSIQSGSIQRSFRLSRRT